MRKHTFGILAVIGIAAVYMVMPPNHGIASQTHDISYEGPTAVVREPLKQFDLAYPLTQDGKQGAWSTGLSSRGLTLTIKLPSYP